MEANTSMSAIMEFFGSKVDDVNLTPEETRKVFKLLGLDLTDEQLQLLEDIPLDEFMQTVDAQLRPKVEHEFDEDEEKLPALPTAVDNGDSISYNQLHEFLKNCHLDIPQNAIIEYLSGCAPANSELGAEKLYVDKAGFNNFLQKYADQKKAAAKTAKNRNKKRKAKAKKRANMANAAP